MVALASDTVKREVVAGGAGGPTQIAALAITEPVAAPDVAQLRTTARREGDEYIVHGEKVFITSACAPTGSRWRCEPVKPKGAGGISLLLVPGDWHQACRASRLDKIGWLLRHRAPAL